MPHRDARLRISDILDSIRKIQTYVQDLDFDNFAKNPILVDSVLLNFIVIGEAASHIPEELKDAHLEIPWQDMIGMRNVVAHTYFRLDLKIVWRTIHNNFDRIVPLLEELIRIV